MSRDLIVFGEDWGGLPSSTQHIIKHLSKTRKVLWVNSIGLRRPRFSCHDVFRATKKVARKLKSSKPIAGKKPHEFKNITVVDLLTIPAPRNAIERYISARLIEKQLKPKINKLGMNNPLLWISLPTAADLVGKLGESGVIYYCGDDFSSLAGVDHKTVEKHEKDLVERSDIIFTASEKLANKFPKEKVITLPHGVDFELFAGHATKAVDLPQNDKPTAGFYGSLSEWLDTELLSKTIASLPDWNFVFIGKEEADMSALKKFDNAYFLGPKSHNNLPNYSRYWQASMLPFKDNEQIRSCNPLKLSEYLAAGTPIVSTNFPALAPYRDLVQSAETSESFTEALELSVHLSELKRHALVLRSCVVGNTWKAKANQVSKRLEAL